MMQPYRPLLWAAPSAAAQAVARHCPQAARAALDRAGEICRGEYVFADHWEMEHAPDPVRFTGPVDWEHSPNGDPEWVYALNRHTIFVNLGKAWRLTGEPRYRDTFLALLEDWLTRVPHTAASEQTAWRALEAGLRAENWLRALGLFSGEIPASLLDRVRESLIQHGEYLYTAHGPFQQLSNWGAIQDHGLFLLGVWAGRSDWQQLALDRLTQNLHNAVLPDGTHWEQSPMYHCEVLHSVADTLLVARRAGIAVPAELEEKTHALATALAAWVMPGRTILPQSDSDVIDAGDLLAQGALLFDDPVLAAAARGPLLEETFWDFGPDAPQKLAALEARRPEAPSQALPHSGNYMLRAGWDPQDTCLHLHTGPLGGGHGHADLLHLDLYHKGEGVLVDGGRGTYVEGPLRRALKSPAAHNTLRLDDTDFTRYLSTWGWDSPAEPLPAVFGTTPAADYLRAGHLGYLDRGCVVERTVVFIKSGWVVVADMLRTADDRPHTARQYFHFGPGALTRAESAVHWQGQKTDARLFWLSGQTPTLGQGTLAPRYNTQESAPTLTLDTTFTGTTVLLTVVALQDRPARVELLPVTDAAGHPLPATAAQALRLTSGPDHSTLLLAHQAPGAGLLCAGGHAGYGRALLFTHDTPGGLCLA